MPQVRRTACLALGLLVASCVDTKNVGWEVLEPERPSMIAEGAGSAILVTIDGVRWQEIFTGADPERAGRAALPGGEARSARSLTPHLHQLFFDDGVVLGDPRVGERFVASGPRYVSLPGYVEMMTGAPSGCLGNDCTPSPPWVLAGEIARRAPEGATAVFSSWERVARAFPGRADGLLLRAGRDDDEQDPAYPGLGDYRPDRRTAALAVEHLVQRKPRFMWVALGDTDEWAHRGDYRGYLDALHFADAFVGELCAHLAEMGDYGARTAVFVTTDHGRDANFADHGGAASAGVWLMARGGPIARRGVTALAEQRRLADIAPTITAVMGEPVRRCDGCGAVLDQLLRGPDDLSEIVATAAVTPPHRD